MNESLPLKEVEKLGYYDFLSYLGVPFFHQGGLMTSLKLADLCHVNKDKKVLMVGCGTGLSACFLAIRLGCNVVGIDIAEVSVNKAKDRAKLELVEDKVEFQVGDACNLSFESDTFDVVITEFVSMFLDKEKAFKEFERVLKPGGYVGIVELSKVQDIPSEINDEILEAEELFREITKLPFRLFHKGQWSNWLEKAGLKNIQIDKYSNHLEYMSTRDLPEYNDQIRIKDLPEYNDQITKPELPRLIHVFRNIIKILSLGFNRRLIKYLLLSQVIRDKWKRLLKAKKVLFKKKTTSRYVGCIFGIGQKELITAEE